MSRKFKLIKEYPGSPKLNTIISIYGYNTHENYPEFWEEIKEEEYRILSFTDGYNMITYRPSKDKYIISTAEDNEWAGCNLKDELDLVKEGHRKIHSVQRLSDNKIFTVGDNVKMFKGTSKIKSFRIISNGEFIIDFENKCATIGIKNIQPIEPLFTTEDGVDIYEGDSYAILVDDKNITQEIASGKTYNKDHTLRFSTVNQARKHVMTYSEIISLKDIDDLIKNRGIILYTDLIKFVGKKLGYE